MAIDPTRIADGFIGCPNGMNKGIDVLSLQATQCSSAINVTFRDTIPMSRPQFENIPGLTIAEGVYQGDAIYSLDSGDFLIIVVSGRIIQFSFADSIVTDLTTKYNLPVLDVPFGQCWFCQAEHFMIIQDGSHDPIVLSPTDGWIADSANNEVPIGFQMAYGHGRLFVVPKLVGEEDGRRFFMAGDIMWPSQPEKLLNFIETGYLAGGGAMALPNEMGFITGMGFMRNSNTGSGQGALVVFCRNGAALFAVNAPRNQWQEIDISAVLFQTGGTLSPKSIVPVNGDLAFRSIDGIRTLSYSRAQLQTMANNPISGAAGNLLDADKNEDLPFVTSAVWDNYLMFTTHRDGTGWKGMLVFDLSPMSYMGQTAEPLLAGIWTQAGLKSLHNARYADTQALILLCAEGGLLVAKRAVAGHTASIRSRLYTRAFNGMLPQDLKQLSSIELSVSNVRVATGVTIYYRPRGYPRWLLGGSTVINAFEGYGRFPFLHIPIQTNTVGCDPITGECLNTSDDFEFCIEWTGAMKVDKFRMICSLVSHGPRMADEMITGDHATFPGVDIEAGDFD